jgi:hypothetical protein
MEHSMLTSDEQNALLFATESATLEDQSSNSQAFTSSQSTLFTLKKKMTLNIGFYLQEIFCDLHIGIKKAMVNLLIDHVEQNWSLLDQTVFLNFYKKLIKTIDKFNAEDEKPLQRQLSKL